MMKIDFLSRKEMMRKEIKINKINIANALLTEITPSAIGRNFFFGCNRSLSTSLISFKIYPPDAIIDIEIKAKREFEENILSNSNARILGKKINRFFDQCFGRINLI